MSMKYNYMTFVYIAFQLADLAIGACPTAIMHVQYATMVGYAMNGLGGVYAHLVLLESIAKQVMIMDTTHECPHLF